jgi:hypothetical protein
VEIPLNLLSRTPFHNIVITKSMPPDLAGDPLQPLGGVIITIVQPVVPYSMPFKKPLNYLEYRKDFDPDVHV